MNITIPKLSPRRPDRPQRLGQEHVRPQALPADRGPLVGRLPGDGQRRRERPGRHEGRLRGAALRRRQAAGPRAADGRRRHQRPARGPQAAGRAGPAVPLPAGGHRARPARAGLPGAEPGRPDRDFGPHVVRNQTSQLRRSLRGLRKEGFRHVFVLETPEEVEAATVERVPLWNDRRRRARPVRHHRRRPRLLRRTGGAARAARLRRGDRAGRRRPVWGDRAYAHPEGRKAVFVGDLVDRGPRILDTVRLVRNMVARGSALCVPGNHDMKLLQEAPGQGRPDHARPGRDAGRDRRPARRGARPVLPRSWPSSSTAWSATTSSTTASWSSPTPG